MARGFNDDEEEEAVSLGQVRLVHVTDDAIKVVSLEEDPLFSDELWVPRTQVHEDSEVFVGMDGDKGELFVTQWWADKKGFQ